MKNLLLLFAFLLVISDSQAQFTLMTDQLRGLREGAATWTDIDSDGDIDLLLFGNDIDAVSYSTFFRNDDLTFNEFDISNFPDLFDGSLDWADYNNDGNLDIAVIAYSDTDEMVISKIFTFDGENFIDSQISLPGVTRGSIDWGDFDNDGAIDLLIVGQDTESSSITKLFKNEGTDFEEVELANVIGVSFGDAAWADFDSDGLFDFIITGVTGVAPDTGPPVTKLYRNTGSGFEETSNDFTGIYESSVDWGDADGDGDLDLLLTGFTAAHEPVTQLYLNEADGFQLVEIGIPGVLEGFAKWGDYDNDGDLDILLVGNTIMDPPRQFRVFSNDNLTFESIFNGPGVGQASGGWADFNNDGFLDIFINGQNENFELVASIYLNDGGTVGGRKADTNAAPTVPANLSAATSGNSVWLSWEQSIDDLTAESSLSYNVTVERNGEIVIPSLSSSNGRRTLVEFGNAGLQSSFRANDLLPGEYQWSVQAIDNSFLASSFAPTGTFTIDGTVVGIAEDPAIGVAVFPNPFYDHLTINGESAQRFRILDAKGVEMVKGGLDSNRINLEILPSGIYFLKIYLSNRIITKLLVKR